MIKIKLGGILPSANEVWGKVIFSQACVKNCVHGGGGCLVQGGGGCLLRGGLHPGGAWWISPDGYCCGRYASYWNAFLLMNKDSTQFVKQLRNLRYPVHSFSISRSCSGIYHLDFLQENHSSKYMSHFAYACKMRYPLNLVLESWEYLWFY